jgi:hypothetical protein
MSTRLVVDKKAGLREAGEEQWPQQPPVIRLMAKVISYLFHPLFIPVYLVLYTVYIHPYFFAGKLPFEKTVIVIRALIMYAFFPAITVFLLKGLKFIDSVYLETRKDRIIPLVACGIWYFWMWYVARGVDIYPGEMIALFLAIWLSSSFALLENIIMKVSLHAISMGVMLMFLVLLALNQSLNFGFWLSAGLLITGLVCSSRFIVSDHTAKEVYGGLATGILSMLIAHWVV